MFLTTLQQLVLYARCNSAIWVLSLLPLRLGMLLGRMLLFLEVWLIQKCPSRPLSAALNLFVPALVKSRVAQGGGCSVVKCLPGWGAAVPRHTFSAFWLWSSVVSVLISVTTDMFPTGNLLVTLIFSGEVSIWACSSGPQVLPWHGTKLGVAHPLG